MGDLGILGWGNQAEEAQGTRPGNIPRGTRARDTAGQPTHCFGTQLEPLIGNPNWGIYPIRCATSRHRARARTLKCIADQRNDWHHLSCRWLAYQLLVYSNTKRPHVIQNHFRTHNHLLCYRVYTMTWKWRSCARAGNDRCWNTT